MLPNRLDPALSPARNVRHALIFICLAAFTGCGNASREMASANLQNNSGELGSKSKLSSGEQADVYFSLARSAEKQGNLQEAVRLYQSTLQKQPKSGEAHWRLAICLDKSGNFQQSAQHYQDALKLMPGNPEIFCDYGYSLALQNRWNDSEMNLKQSIAIQPQLKRAHNNLGLVLAQGSKLDEARREFQIGGLSLADAHWNLGQMLVSQSRWDEARSEFQRIKAISPDDPQVNREIASLNRLVAKLDNVRKASQNDTSLVRVSAEMPATK